MHVCRCRRETDANPWVGIVDVDGKTVRPLESGAASLETVLKEADWPAIRESVGEETVALENVTLLAPVERPTNLIGIGLNYAGHAAEGGHSTPEEPIFFAKSPSSIADPNGPIRKHPEVDELHYEGEFALVIGKKSKNVGIDDALDHVFGFTAANDVTAREMQATDLDQGSPWYRSKSMDTFTPLGPWVSPVGEGVDPDDAAIRTILNGSTVQNSATDDLIFGVSEVVAYVSRFVTLYPGDVILTGTPAGIGEIVPGDSIEVEIDGIGTLRNQVTS